MTLQFKRPDRGGRRRIGLLLGNKRGNIAIITALMMIPLTFALGMAYDYTMAESRQDQINGMADVATLGGVTPTQMAGSLTDAEAYSLNLFTSQLATVNGVAYNVSNIDMSQSNQTASGTSVTRNITINYTAASKNVFATLLGMPTFPLKGSSTATSSTAPNIDFYLMMDTSPSMEIAATSAGIATMISNTQQESDATSVSDSWPNPPGVYATGGKFSASPHGNGCAFGCHESTPSEGTFEDSTGHPIKCTATGTYSDGVTQYQAWQSGDPLTPPYTFPTTGRDNYDLSRCTGVVLRIDLLNTAAQNLMDVAKSTAANDNATYRMAIFVSAYNNQPSPLSLYKLQALTSDLSQAKTSAASIAALEMCNNNHLACGDSNGDMDTNLDGNLTSMNSTSWIPNPGTGTNNAGDTPQEVLFIVTDAQNDLNSGGRKYTPMDKNGTLCTAIKNRGIRIAVLYTTYTPLEESWYQTAVEPALGYTNAHVPYVDTTVTDKLATAAQACASPGLYYQVSTDGDISAALALLFQEAVSSARLLK